MPRLTDRSQRYPGLRFQPVCDRRLSGGANNPLIYDPQTGVAFPNNVIPTRQDLRRRHSHWSNCFSPTRRQPRRTAAAGNTGIAGNYSASGQGIFNADQWDARVDLQATQRFMPSGASAAFTDTLTGSTIFGAAGGTGFGLANYGGTSVGANDSVAAGADMAVNATLLTDFRRGYYRYNAVTSKYDQGSRCTLNLGIPDSNLGRRLYQRRCGVQY